MFFRALLDALVQKNGWQNYTTNLGLPDSTHFRFIQNNGIFDSVHSNTKKTNTLIVFSWNKFYNMSTEDTKSAKILCLEKRDQRDHLVSWWLIRMIPLKLLANFGCLCKVFGLKYKSSKWIFYQLKKNLIFCHVYGNDIPHVITQYLWYTVIICQTTPR